MTRYKHTLCFLIVLHVFTIRSLAEELFSKSENIDPSTDKKYGSLEAEPEKLLHAGNALGADSERIVNLARSSPVYVRLRGAYDTFYGLDGENSRNNKETRNLAPSEAPSTTRGKNNSREPRDLKERVEVLKQLIQDRDASKTDRRRQKNVARVPRRPDARRELRKLRKFVKQKLDDREERRTPNVGGSSRTRNNVGRRKSANEQLRSVEDTRARLQEFKDRLSRIRNLTRTGETRTAVKNSMNEIVGSTLSLISKVRDSLATGKREENHGEKAKASVGVRDSLKSLYNLLTNVNLEPVDDSGDQVDKEQTRRSKKDLIADTGSQDIEMHKTERPRADVTGDSGSQQIKVDRRSKRDLRKITEPPERESLSRRSAKEGRKIKRMEEARKRVQPSVFELGSSEENTFYGFFETEPVEGFPEGDVFFAAGDRRYDETSDQEADRQREFSTADHPENEDVPTEDENDYLEPNEFHEYRKNSQSVSVNPAASEIWEAETYGHERKERSSDEQGDRSIGLEEGIPIEGKRGMQESKNNLRHLTGYYRTISKIDKSKSGSRRSIVRSVKPRQIPTANYERSLRLINRRSKLTDQKKYPVPEDTDFSKEHGVQESSRSKRGNLDLNAIFAQEMINEDDANSKDCKCRVIRSKVKPGSYKCRSKRDASGPVETMSERETITDSSIDTVDPNLDVAFVEEAPGLVDTSIEALELQTEPQHFKIERKTNLSIQETQPETERIIIYSDATESSLEDQPDFPVNLEVPSPLPNSKNDENLLSKAPARRDDTFFREESQKNEEEEAKVDTVDAVTQDTSNIWENSTPFASENLEEIQETAFENSDDSTETSETQFADSNTEISDTGTETFVSATETESLSVEAVAKEPEGYHRNDNLAGGSLKRAVEVSENSQQSRNRTKSPATLKRRTSNVKSPEARLMDRVKALVTLRREIDKRRERKVMETAPKAGSSNTRDYQRNRGGQVRGLREKSREKRERMLQRYQKDILDVIEEIEDEENRELKRREAWEAIKDRDDFRDAIDREKHAYILMYSPDKRKMKREDNVSEESTETDEVPTTELVRARRVRERIFWPKNRPNFRDSTILEHPNPRGLRERIIELTNLYENEGGRRERLDEDTEGDKSYFALVEDLKEPRIFQKFRNDKRRSVETSSPYSRFLETKNSYDLLRLYFEKLGTLEESSEEDSEELSVEEDSEELSNEEDSEELSSDREIYIIDPSKYRGGEPTLQLYKSPSKQKAKTINDRVYEMIWEPVPYKIDRTEQYKREDRGSGESPEKSNEEREDPGKLRDPSGNLNGGELLRILINALDARSAEELLKRLAGQNSVEKRNFMRSIGNEANKESGKNTNGVEEGDDHYGTAEDEQSSEEGESLERSVNSEDTADTEENSSDNEKEGAKIRNRRDSSTLSMGEESREMNKSARIRYLRLKGESGETSGEDSSKVFEIVKESSYYKLVPLEGVETKTANILSKDSKPLALRMRNRTNQHQDFKETKSEERSEDVPSDHTKTSAVVGNNGDESANFKDLSDSDQPEKLTTSPWQKKFGRHRRQAENLDSTNENVSVEKVRPVGLQQLEELSSRRISTSGDMDDVERSIAAKQPLEKYTKKENSVNGEKNAVGSSNEDQGLPSLLEGSIPKLQNVVVNSLERAQNLTESVEQLIGNLDEKFNETSSTNKEGNSVNPKPIDATPNVFNSAITNVKKFFMLLAGLTRIFRGTPSYP